MSEFKLGDIGYYPLKNEIIKSTITEIRHTKNGIHYQLSCSRTTYGNMLFKTFQEAVEYCLKDEKEKYERECEKIRKWKE